MLLQVHNLEKRYGGRTVVHEVCFNVGEREIVGLLGANGAGKTTSFRMAMGMVTPDGGRVEFKGRDVTALPMYQRARLGMGYLAQEPSVFQRLTVEQNLLAICETRSMAGAERRRRVEELMERFGLTKLRRSMAKTLSGGERRKLEIARALISQPDLLLLDEPFSGIDPKKVEDLRAEIAQLREQGIAILLTDHNVHETLKVTDRSYVIFNGEVICDGPPHKIINDKLVRETYLGNTFRGDEFSEPLSPPPIGRIPPDDGGPGEARLGS